MKRFWKYLKKYTGILLLILLFTGIFSFANLSLPNQMSKIVNVGLQQNGIEELLPQAMTEQSLEEFALLLPSDQAAVFKEGYIYTAPESAGEQLKEEIRGLQTQPLYILDAAKAEQIKTAAGSDLAAYWMLYGELKQVTPQNTVDDIFHNQNSVTGFPDLKAMNGAERESFLARAMSVFRRLPETTLRGAASATIAAEYQSVGIDLDHLRSRYIGREGINMLLLSILVGLASVIVVWLSARVASRIGQDMRKQLFRKAISFSDRDFERFSSSSLINRTTNDIQQIQMSLVMILRTVLQSPLMAIGAITMALRINATMSWIILMSSAAVILLMGIIYKIASPKFNLMQKLVDKVSQVMQESLAGILVVRAFNTQEREEGIFDEANRALTKNTLFTTRAVSFMSPLMGIIMNVTGIAIVWIGARQVDYGTLQIGNIMAFIQYSMMTIMQFMFLSIVSIMLPRSLVSVERVDEVITTEVSIADRENGTPEFTNALEPGKSYEGTHLCFDHVRFRFPDSEANALIDIDFEVYPGKTLAIIGGTGSGKSTICRLVPRFLDVSEGHICLNGVDVRDLKMADLRNKIGYVPQKAMLFSGTVRSNMQLGKNSNAGDEEIYEALEIACAADIVRPEEGGLDRPVARGGSNLSGGQKQRLCIARALIGAPDIVLFDDSFSALDYRTDAQLRRNLQTFRKDTAFIIVAQRISTIRSADEILVLDEGKIIGRGTHDELIRTNLIYREIALSQNTLEQGGEAV